MSTSTRIKRVIPVALYTVFYLLCFSYLENRHVRYHIIDSSLDDKIPFCEYFIIPYLLWFLYIAVTVGYFLFFREYNRVLEPDFESCHRYDIIFNCILCISKRTEYPSGRIYQRFCFHPYGSVPVSDRYTNKCTSKHSCI